MTHLNLFRGAAFLFLALFLLVGSSVQPLYAQETEACIDFNTPYERISYGFDSQSYENAEKKAINSMRLPGINLFGCGGEPVVLCKDKKVSVSHGHNSYKVRVRFACPSDEGINIENNKPKSFKFSYKIGSGYTGDSYFRTTDDAHYPRMAALFKKNCNQEPRTYEDGKHVSVEYLHGGGSPFLSSYTPSVYKKTVLITCPSSTKITVDHEAIGKDKGSPDPRKNWRYEKWWSGESFDAAKRKCDTKVAEKNLCRFRGGAVDITYKETRSEHYWVSLRYRCRYD